jgi:hypothetical protein
MFLVYGKKPSLEIFINFFPSLLVIKVEIFNCPFYIFGYTMKTKYKNLEIFIYFFPSLLVIKVEIFNYPFYIFGYTLKPNMKIWNLKKKISHHFLWLSSNL